MPPQMAGSTRRYMLGTAPAQQNDSPREFFKQLRVPTVAIRMIRCQEAGDLLTRKKVRLAEAERAVAPILEDVRRRGDAAVCEYARRFDGFEGESFAVPAAECEEARNKLEPAFLLAVVTAANNIRTYAEAQLPREQMIQYPDGRRVGWIVRPVDSMGAYIPAGRHPLPSTLLMTAIPAQVAGVKTISVACPRPSAEILGVAAYLNVPQLFRIGGAQAIAALAYGTETVPKVDRIVGPGSIYVAAAKKLISGDTGIDFIAGPTEIAIIAEDGEPAAIAADMLAQAEHDSEASAILLTSSRALAEAVAGEIERQLVALPTAPVAREAILDNSAIVLVDSMAEAVDFVNRLAPEHLMLHDPSLLPAVRHAGSIFLGPNSPEAAGDYCTGPNHVLPTSGVARLRGGLSAADFVKVISVQELTPAALAGLAPAITTLARAEGLEAHARSVEVRTRG
jgi:histidinol dehydrogenase